MFSVCTENTLYDHIAAKQNSSTEIHKKKNKKLGKTEENRIRKRKEQASNQPADCEHDGKKSKNRNAEQHKLLHEKSFAFVWICFCILWMDPDFKCKSRVHYAAIRIETMWMVSTHSNHHIIIVGVHKQCMANMGALTYKRFLSSPLRIQIKIKCFP